VFILAISALVGLGSAAAAAVPAASPTPAGTGGGGDATGDTSPIADCHSDITSFAGDYLDQTISLRTGVACGSDPINDANWYNGLTEADWGLDVNGDGYIDYVAAVANVNGYVGAVLEGYAIVCDGTPQWDGDRTFGISFDAACIGDPPSFRMQSWMRWDENPGQPTCDCPEDLAPDGTGLSGDIVRSAGPPPLGYPTACNRTDTAASAFADAGLAADCLRAWGLALGKDDGTFGENDSLLRSQVSSLLARLLTTNGVSLDARRPFPDVNANTVPNAQVRDEIERLAGAGIIAGFPDNTFGPAGTLSVAQAATFVVRALQLLNSQIFTDFDVQDQGTTTANYTYALDRGIIDPQAKNINGAMYPNGASDATMRGLLADMMAQSLEKVGKVYYATCSEAQAAGAAPLFMGDAGYRPVLDPDGDGITCE
jgi:hypothetical protein